MRVLVAGGGIAALEALAGLHALARERVEPTLLAPEASFSYRPLSTAVPFTFHEERRRSLAELAGGLGARFVRDALAVVDDARGRVLTHDGDFLPYDVLVVAVGARPSRQTGPGLTWSRADAAGSAFAAILRELEAGTVRSVAFVVPPRAAWPIDAYELSFVAGLAARRGGRGAKVFLVTAEERPLEALGAAAGEALRDELARAGIQLLTGVETRRPAADGERGLDAFSSVMARLSRQARRRSRRRVVLHLEPGQALAVDRVVSLPEVHGPALPGVAHDERGFVPVDASARIAGSSRLFAAGDATSLRLKHSLLASSQATAAAEAIAADAGAGVAPTPWSGVLYGILTLPPHFAGPRDSPWLAGGEPLTHCLWWPPGHVAGRSLAPYLASRDPAVRSGLDWHPGGLPVAVRVDGASTGSRVPAAVPSQEALREDALTRRSMSIRRAEREGEQLAGELRGRLDEFGRHELEVIKRLEAAGYLSGAAPAGARTAKPPR